MLATLMERDFLLRSVDANWTTADWERLPMLEKHELRERGDALRSSRSPGGLKATTSGTSGLFRSSRF